MVDDTLGEHSTAWQRLDVLEAQRSILVRSVVAIARHMLGCSDRLELRVHPFRGCMRRLLDQTVEQAKPVRWAAPIQSHRTNLATLDASMFPQEPASNGPSPQDEMEEVVRQRQHQ